MAPRYQPDLTQNKRRELHRPTTSYFAHRAPPATLPTYRRYENVENYKPGGYYAVDLHQLINNQFKIIYKRNFDEYSTVWLARDVSERAEHRWVWLRIFTSEQTKAAGNKANEAGLERYFKGEGLNQPVDKLRDAQEKLSFYIYESDEEHLCLVWPVLCAVPDLLEQPLQMSQVQKSGRIIAKKLRHLHNKNHYYPELGIYRCVFNMKDSFNECTEMDIYRLCGEPEDLRVKTGAVETNSRRVPAYLYSSPEYKTLDEAFANTALQPSLIEWNYFAPNAQKSALQTPQLEFLAPELEEGSEGNVGKPSNIWDFGCMLIQLLTGITLKEWVWKHWAFGHKGFDVSPNTIGVISSKTPLLVLSEERLSIILRLIIDTTFPSTEAPKKGHNEDEKNHLHRLLRKIFVYKPSDRISAKLLAADDWFKTDEKYEDEVDDEDDEDDEEDEDDEDGEEGEEDEEDEKARRASDWVSTQGKFEG